MVAGRGNLIPWVTNYISHCGTAIRGNCGTIGIILVQLFHDNRLKSTFVGVVRSQCVLSMMLS